MILSCFEEATFVLCLSDLAEEYAVESDLGFDCNMLNAVKRVTTELQSQLSNAPPAADLCFHPYSALMSPAVELGRDLHILHACEKRRAVLCAWQVGHLSSPSELPSPVFRFEEFNGQGQRSLYFHGVGVRCKQSFQTALVCKVAAAYQALCVPKFLSIKLG